MAEPRKEKSLKETNGWRREFSPLFATSCSYSSPPSSFFFATLPFFSAFFPPATLRLSPGGKDGLFAFAVTTVWETSCGRLAGSVLSTLGILMGTVNYKRDGYAPLSPSPHSFRKRVMQIDTFSMIASASDRCLPAELLDLGF